jgi:demethylmenaquinone methyltransferase / 2-methoxy-6-polyprenyl-1,4-benzoquinol methylase
MNDHQDYPEQCNSQTKLRNGIHPLQNYYSKIYKSYDLVNKLFTLGFDRKWRNYLIGECLKPNPSNILDLCCGTGDIAIGLKQKAHGHIRVTGYDLNAHMLEIAEKKSLHQGIELDFIQGDAAELPFSDNHFDCITIGFGFRNLTWKNPNSNKHISEISRVMKKGAILYILESTQPENRLIRFFYSLYLRFILVPLGGVISGNWNAYRYLAGSSAFFYCFGDLQQLMAPFGLSLTMNRKFMLGSVNLLTAFKS